MAELSDEVHGKIKAICAEADVFAEAGKYKQARNRYWDAFDLVPAPAEDWEATTWILAAIGDAFFREKDFEHAKDAFQDAVRCAGGLGNVFIHLRLGQCFFELKDHPRAGDNLARAFMGGSEEAFKNEDEKYLSYLKREHFEKRRGNG